MFLQFVEVAYPLMSLKSHSWLKKAQQIYVVVDPPQLPYAYILFFLTVSSFMQHEFLFNRLIMIEHHSVWKIYGLPGDPLMIYSFCNVSKV